MLMELHFIHKVDSEEEVCLIKFLRRSPGNQGPLTEVHMGQSCSQG
jgi:hypothetical protein